MIAKKIKSASVDKSDAKNYMKRAQELLESMKNNLVMDNWNAAVIDGVHSAISANDAITVLSSGKRCTSSHHLDAVELLNQSLPSNVKKETGRLRKIINVKSHVEYGPSLVREKDAYKIANDVESFVMWAEGVFKKFT